MTTRDRVFFPLFRLVTAGAALGSVGCVSVPESTFAYQPPPERLIRDEATFPRPLSEVWDALVAGLARSEYVIETIEKESRLISLSFASETPEDFVTGGTATRTFRYAEDSDRFTYDLAASSFYTTGTATSGGLPLITTVNRRSSLAGRASIHLTPLEEPDSTRVAVNANFFVQVTASARYLKKNFLGGEHSSGEIGPGEVMTASCSTRRPSTVNWGTPEEPSYVTFRSTGELESRLLSFADPGGGEAR